MRRTPLTLAAILAISIPSAAWVMRHAPAAVAPAPTPPAASTVPLGHFRLTLQIKHDIEKEQKTEGPIVYLKQYDPITLAQADFYLPEGPDIERIADLPGGRRIFLKMVDLKLKPDVAAARQYVVDANFQTQTAVGQYAASPFALTSQSPSPEWHLNKPSSQMLAGMGKLEGGVQVSAQGIIELTYLGETSAHDLMKKSDPPPLVDALPAGFSDQVDADARNFRARQPAP